MKLKHFLLPFLVKSKANAILATSNSAGDHVLAEFFLTVSSCTGITIPMQSCLMTHFLQDFVKKKSITIDPSGCTAPSVGHGEIESILNEGRIVCRYDEPVDIVAKSIEEMLQNDWCWKTACEEAMKLDQTGDVSKNEPFTIIKSKIIEFVSNCSGYQLSNDDCIVSTSLGLLVEDLTNLLSGEIISDTFVVEFLQGGRLPEPSRHLTQSICAFLPITKDRIGNVVDEARDICSAMEMEWTAESVDQTKNAMNRFIGGEGSCAVKFWEYNVTNVVDKTKKEIQNLLSEFLKHCSRSNISAVFAFDSCVMNTSLELLFQQAVSEIAKPSSSYLFRRGLEENLRTSNVCSILFVPFSEPNFISDILDISNESCLSSSGQGSNNLELVKHTIEEIFSSENHDSCLVSMCNDVIDLGLSTVKKKILHEISACTGADDLSRFVDSCIVSSLVDSLVNAFFHNTLHYDDLRSIVDFFQKYESLSSNDICDIFPVENLGIFDILNDTKLRCGKDLSGAQEIETAIRALFSDSSCLPTLCDGRLIRNFGDPHENIQENTRNAIYEDIFKCASIDVNKKSCIHNTFLDELQKWDGRENKISNVYTNGYSPSIDSGGKGRRRQLQISSTKSPSAYPSMAPTPAPTFLCPITRPKLFEKHKLIDRALERCENVGIIPTQELMKAHNIVQRVLHADDCWDQICSEDFFLSIMDQHVYYDVTNASQTKEVSIHFMIQCANIEFTNSSCIQSSLINEIKWYEKSNRRLLSRNVRRLQSSKSPRPSITSTHMVQPPSTKSPSTSSSKAPIASVEKPTAARPEHTRLSTKAPALPLVSSHPTLSPSSSKMPFPHKNLPDNSQCLLSKPNEATMVALLSKAINRCNIDRSISTLERFEAEKMVKILMQENNCWKQHACAEHDALVEVFDKCFNYGIPSPSYEQSSTEVNIHMAKDIQVQCMVKHAIAKSMNTVFTSDSICSLSFHKESMKSCYAYSGPAAYDFCNTGDGTYTFDDRDALVNRFCSLMETITSDEGQKCLESFCFASKEIPETKPSRSSIPPTSVKTGNATDMPSISPSIISSQLSFGLLEINVEASLSISFMSISALPSNVIEFNVMVNTIEDVLRTFLPNQTKRIRVLNVGGISTDNFSGRRMEENVLVDLEFTLETKCETAYCDESDELTGVMVTSMKTAMETAVSSGDFAASLQQKSNERSVTIFENVEITSFTIKNIVTKVLRTEGETDLMDGKASAASNVGVLPFAFFTFSGFSILLLIV